MKSIFNFHPEQSRRTSFILKKGFTLIELLVVIVIIGVLSAFLVANFVGIKERARDAQRKSDLRNIQAALEIYRSDTGSYPDNTAWPSCNSSFANGASVYMQVVPCDPLTGNYSYSYNAGAYTLIACLENAEDSQKDIANVSPCDTTGATNWSYTLKNP